MDMFANVVSHSDKCFNMMLVEQGIDVVVFLVGQLCHLLEIREDEGFPRQLGLCVHKVEGGAQGVDIQAVGIVDEHRVLDTLQNLGTHTHARQLLQALVDLGRFDAQLQHHHDAVGGILQGSGVEEGNVVSVPLDGDEGAVALSPPAADRIAGLRGPP